MPSSAPGSALGKTLGSMSAGLLMALAGVAVAEGAIAPKAVRAQSAAFDPEIKVGIVQRFGEEAEDQLTLGPLPGDALTIRFQTGAQVQTLTTNRLQIGTTMQPLSEPVLQEWVVLSTHRSFESAEDSAKNWEATGISAEIAQPDAWQVWAKREDYSSPLVRRLLLKNLHAAGHTEVFIDTQVVAEVPKATFTANGYQYTRDEFTITSANRRIQMAEGDRTRYQDLFAGDMKVQPNVYGNYTLVNQVPIEQYLRGVVPHEIGAGAPRSAIEAQAVLARTYALRNLRRFAIDDYEICADTQCQVYFGLAETDPGSDAAIAATAGQVLTYENELVDALYSSTTGGVTARFTDVWDGTDRPYLTPVIDSLQAKWDLAARPLSDEANFRAFIGLSSGFNEDTWSEFRWNRTATLAQMDETLKEYLQNRQHSLAGYNQLTGMTVIERAASGRVRKLRVETDIGSFDLVKDEAVKALLPPRSLLFYVEPMIMVPPGDSTGTQSGGGPSALPAVTGPSASRLSDPKPSASGPSTVPPASRSSAPESGEANPEANPTARKLSPLDSKSSPKAAANSAKSAPTLGNKQAPEPVITGFRFVGGGFGHGVGMSQTGAYNLGQKGYSHQQILEFYYPGTSLQPISESITFWDAN